MERSSSHSGLPSSSANLPTRPAASPDEPSATNPQNQKCSLQYNSSLCNEVTKKTEINLGLNVQTDQCAALSLNTECLQLDLTLEIQSYRYAVVSITDENTTTLPDRRQLLTLCNPLTLKPLSYSSCDNHCDNADHIFHHVNPWITLVAVS